MKNSAKYLNICLLALITLPVFSQDFHVRIAFIGNSITIGSGLSNPTRDCYPSQLGVMLKEVYGDTCIITNYAVSGRTMLKKGDYPIWNEPDFTKCLNYAPDICFIDLGTNDTKPYNWDDYGQEFFADYKAMIDTFTARNPATKFIVCYPPPAFAVVWDIRNPVIIGEVIPLVDSIVKVTGADLINFYNPLLDSVSLFPDKIHPNVQGAKAMAKIAFDNMVNSGIIHKAETGHTFATSLKSNITGELRSKDPALISWTTLNATEALLNGVKVDLNGNFTVIPDSTTKYTLVAKSETETDSIVFFLKVYIPVITRLSAIAATRTIYVGNSSKIKLSFYDQKSKPITDSIFDIKWTAVDGYGHFTNITANSADFVGDSAGTCKAVVSIRNLSYSIPMTIKGFPTSVDAIQIKSKGNVYPNPFSESLFIELDSKKSGNLNFQLFDITGRMLRNESYDISSMENQILEINTNLLKKGIYFYKLKMNDDFSSGKLVKE